MARVFISYDREDSDFAELVDGRLAKAGHSAYMDVEILNAGEAWREKLDQAIRGADVMVVIMTPDARASDYVAYEWAFALGAGVRVVPLELKPTDVHPRLDTLQRLDFTDKQRPWQTLLVEIEKAAEATQSTTVPVPAGTPPTIKSAVAALDSLDVEEQLAGVHSLVNTDHPAARNALAGALQHPVKTVRMAVAIKFPDRSDPRRLPGLFDIHKDINKSNGFIRKWYPGQPYRVEPDIVQIGAPAVPRLLEALKDQDPDVRWLGATALGQMEENRATEALIGLLRDDSALVREAAARALGGIGASQAGADLVQALGDEADNVRAAAALALGSVRHNAGDLLLSTLEDESERARAAAAEALGVLGHTVAVTKLIKHLRNDKYKVRVAAALALGRLGDPAAIPPLVEAIGDETDNNPSRIAAAQALGLIGNRDAVTALRAYLTDRQNQAQGGTADLDITVAEALLTIEGEGSIVLVGQALSRSATSPPAHIIEHLGSFGQSAVPALMALLEHPYVNVQRSSAASLRKIGTPDALAAVAKWNRSS